MTKMSPKPDRLRLAATYKGGFRKDLNVFVRSEWEAIVLRWLNYKNKKWEYEPKRFVFEDIKSGTKSYFPDIYLPEEDIWIEIKGYTNKSDKTRLKRFKKYYPEEFKKLRMIIRKTNKETREFIEKLGIPVYMFFNDIEKDLKSAVLTSIESKENTISGWELSK